MAYTGRRLTIIQKVGLWGILLFLDAFGTTNARAQIKDIPIGKEVTMDRLYVGLLANTPFLEQSTEQYNHSSFQMGARIQTWLIPKALQIRSFGTLKLIEGQALKFFKSYEAIVTPLKKVTVHLGTMATPSTQLRPNPTTWQSQVETNAERTILGGRPGIKINYRFDENLNLTYGLHNHDGIIVPHVKISYGHFSVSSYWERDHLFFATRWDLKNGSLVATLFKNEVATSAILPVTKTYRPFVDMAYDFQKGELIFGEWGVRKHFPLHGAIKGFISLSYNHSSRNFVGGLFVHI